MAQQVDRELGGTCTIYSMYTETHKGSFLENEGYLRELRFGIQKYLFIKQKQNCLTLFHFKLVPAYRVSNLAVTLCPISEKGFFPQKCESLSRFIVKTSGHICVHTGT